MFTLGDVLFDTGQATLKPGAASTLDRLAQFMRDYPERRGFPSGSERTAAARQEQSNGPRAEHDAAWPAGLDSRHPPRRA